MLSALRQLLTDLVALFPQRHARLWFLLLATTLLQAGYWYLGNPGPTLLEHAPQSLATSMAAVGWAVVLLLVVPWALLPLFGVHLEGVGVGLGNLRYGLWLSLVGALAAIVLMAPVATLPAMQATYPWAGAWVGSSYWTLLAWTGLYACYYVAFEFFYRGVLLRALTPHWGFNTALWVQALLATMIHVGKPLPETVASLPASLIFGVMAYRSGSLLSPILIHLSIGVSLDIWVLLHQGQLLP